MGGPPGTARRISRPPRFHAQLGTVRKPRPRNTRDSVLPTPVQARLAVEAGVLARLAPLCRGPGDVIGVDRFGASAPGRELMREYGFSTANVCQRALALLGQKGI